MREVTHPLNSIVSVQRWMDYTVRRNEIRLYPTTDTIKMLTFLLSSHEPAVRRELLKENKNIYSFGTRTPQESHPLFLTNMVETVRSKWHDELDNTLGLTDWGKSALLAVKNGYMWSSNRGPLPEETAKLYETLNKFVTTPYSEVELPIFVPGSYWYEKDDFSWGYKTSENHCKIKEEDLYLLQQSLYARETKYHETWGKHLVVWRLEG